MKPILRRTLIAVVLVFSLLRFIHLSADFPMHNWFELAAYTDEGWYNSAAVRAAHTGDWLKPGDFNPAVATPVLPAVDYLLFRAFGSGLAVARAAAALCFLIALLGGYALLRRFEGPPFALTATGLCAVSFYGFAFSRLALLEYPALALLFAALNCAALERPPLPKGLLTGALFAAAVMTKMSAGFAAVPLAYLLLARADNRKEALRAAAAAAAVAAIIFFAWWRLLIVPHIADFRFFMSIQYRVKPSFPALLMSALRSLRHGLNVGPVLYPLALVGGVACLFLARVRSRPLFIVAMLWTATYFAYLTYRAYAPIRYYPLLYPMLVVLLLYAARALYQRSAGWGAAAAAVIALCAVGNGLRIADYLLHPHYSFLSMATEISAQVEHNGPGAVLLGNFADTIALVHYVDALNSDYGSAPLARRLSQYPPRFFVQAEPDPSADPDLGRFYRMTLIDDYRVFGSGPASAQVLLYRLDPLAGGG